jgi:hypothetical protein
VTTVVAAVALLLGVVRPPPTSPTVQVVETRRAAEDCTLAREEGFASGLGQCAPVGFSLGAVVNAAILGGIAGYYFVPTLSKQLKEGSGNRVHVEAHISSASAPVPAPSAVGYSPKTLKDGGRA